MPALFNAKRKQQEFFNKAESIAPQAKPPKGKNLPN